MLFLNVGGHEYPAGFVRALTNAFAAASLFVTPLLAVGTLATPAHADWVFLPSDYICLDKQDVTWPDLACFREVAGSGSPQGCLSGGGNLAAGKGGAICWLPDNGQIPKDPAKRSFTADEVKAVAGCLGSRKSAMLKGGKVSCVATSAEVAKKMAKAK